MTRILMAMVLVVLLTGCGGVWMNAEYSGLLTSTAQLSAETAARAQRGDMTPDEMKEALVNQSVVWAKFVDAKECRK